MDKSYLQIGNKIEVIYLGRLAEGKSITYITEKEKEQRAQKYSSQILNILPQHKLEIVMPLEKGKIVLLPYNILFELRFYTSKGIYRSFVEAVDRYKENNIHVLIVQMKTRLEKYQRRNYYRLECLLDVKFRPMTNREVNIDSFDKVASETEENMKELKRGTIVDLSGGGSRFISDEKLEKDSYQLLFFYLQTNNEIRTFYLPSKVLLSEEIPEQHGRFENRVQFMNLSDGNREAIIKFIFEEERKKRKSQKG